MMRLLTASVVLIFFGHVASAEAKVQLTCASPTGGKFIFLLSEDQREADFVSVSPTVSCALEVGATEYLVNCPKTDQRHETRMEVNRYTGNMGIEWGPSFSAGGLNMGNTYHSGTCTTSAEKNVNAGSKMHRRSGAKMHQPARPDGWAGRHFGVFDQTLGLSSGGVSSGRLRARRLLCLSR